MSNSLAIAAVTATLRNFLAAVQTTFPGTVVSTQPPNTARPSDQSPSQLNLFLYQVTPNIAWRNQDMPDVRPGETGQPPLALDLYYLLTSFGLNDDDVVAHQLLGHAMSILYAHPVLNRNSIRDALAGNDLHEQIERIRITPEPLSMDDLFKMWSTFQTEYRISVAYKVTVVLIESQQPVRAPLPVLAYGPAVQPSLLPPYPTITEIELPNNAPSVRLGETVSIHGHHLDGDAVTIEFDTERRTLPLVLSPDAGGTDTNVTVTLPDDVPAQTAWVAGFYRVRIAVMTSGDVRQTNTFAISIAPRITSLTPNPLSLAAGTPLTIATEPELLAEQQPRLILGSRPLLPQNITGDQLQFDLSQMDEGEYFCRLRVDGIDSHVINYAATPPAFDIAMQLVVTA